MKRAPRQPLPATVRLLGWVSFAADVSSEMIYPLLPLFMTGVLHAPALSLGILEGTAQALVSVLAGLSGAWSDRSRRRTPLIRLGYGAPIFGKAAIAVATGWQGVFCGRLIDRLGKGLRGAPRDALIADAITPERRGEAFGFHRMMDTSGAVAGVLIAAAIFWRFSGTAEELAFRAAFWAATLFATASFVITWWVKEAVETSAPSSEAPRRQTFRSLPADCRVTVAILGVFALANSSDAFLLLRAADLGFRPVEVILAYALYNLSYAALSYPCGVLSDRVGRWPLVIFGWCIYAAVYGGLAVTGEAGMWWLCGVYGLFMALTDGVAKALVLDTVTPEQRGSALGALQLVTGICGVLTNVVAGLLWDRFGHRSPFVVSSVFALLGCAIATFRVCWWGRARYPVRKS